MLRGWALLRNRDYMLLWSGQTLSELGSQTSTVAYPLLILALTGSAAKTGVVGLAKWLPLAVFALPAGALADRVDRKRLMIATDAVRLLGAGSIVALLWLGRPPYLQIVLVAFLDGAMLVTSHIAERGALSQIVRPDQVPDAVAQNEARYFGAAIVGPPLGGVLFATARALPFLVDAVSFLGSVTATSMTRARFQAGSERAGLRASFTEGFAWLRGQPFFLTASSLFALGNPVYTGMYLLAILEARRHGASPAAIGAMFAIVAVCGVCGAAAAGSLRRRFSARGVIVAGQWMLLIAAALFSVAGSAWVLGLIVGAAEFLAPVNNSVVAGARVAVTPDRLQGRVGATSAMIAMSLGWLGPLAVGLSFQHAGPTATVLIVVGWTLILALASTLAPALRRPPTLPRPCQGSP